MTLKRLACFIVICFASQSLLSAQRRGNESLPILLSQFRSTQDLEAKEGVLAEITANFPDSGPALLDLAETTTEVDTKWMAIRGIGALKYQGATPFLVESLRSEYPNVRANSARALGEIKAHSAAQPLIKLLGGEEDGGVIEQTSLALQMIGAVEAVPVLESKASNPSEQTRRWIFQAIGVLGSKDDVPFLAGHLYEENPEASMSAAQAIERIMRVDFGIPKGNGPSDPEEGLKNARLWWDAHKSRWAIR